MKRLWWDIVVSMRARVPSLRNARRRLRRAANVGELLKSAPQDNDALALVVAQRLEPALSEEFERRTTFLRERASRLDRDVLLIEGEVTNGRASFEGAVGDLARGVAFIAAQARAESDEAQRDADEAAQHVRRFRLEHGIARPVQDPPHLAKTVGVLGLTSMFEGLCVCFLLEDAVPGGLPEAALIGVGTGLATVVLGSIVGHYAGRAMNGPGWVPRLVGAVGSLLGLTTMGALHVALASWRQNVLARRHLLGSPMAVVWGVPLHLETVATVALGVAFGVFAWSTAKRGRFSDPMPGYLEATRDEQASKSHVGEIWREARDKAREIAADVLGDIAAQIADLERKRGSINLLFDCQRCIAARAERIASVHEGAAARIFREALAPAVSGPVAAPELHLAQNLLAFAPGQDVDRVDATIQGAISALGDARKSVEEVIDGALSPFDPHPIEMELAR